MRDWNEKGVCVLVFALGLVFSAFRQSTGDFGYTQGDGELPLQSIGGGQGMWLYPI